jgi:hypothetical protein
MEVERVVNDVERERGIRRAGKGDDESEIGATAVEVAG